MPICLPIPHHFPSDCDGVVGHGIDPGALYSPQPVVYKYVL